MFGRLFVTLAVLSTGVLACGTTSGVGDGTSSGGSSSGGASSEQIGGCKESCNKMKFFGCNSAEQQAACFDDCGKATPAQIELFTSCAGTSICDPACRTNITPKPAGGGPVTGTGATPASCGTACDKLISCSIAKVGDKSNCLSLCEKEAYQYQIDCVNNTECGKIKSACGGAVDESGGGSEGSSGGTDGDAFSITRCQTACDQLLFRDCIDPAAQSACRAKCAATSTTTAKRDTFSSCVSVSLQCTVGNGCYSAF